MRARPSLAKGAAVAIAFTFGLLAWMAAAPVPAPARRVVPAAPTRAAPTRAAIAPGSPSSSGPRAMSGCASQPP